MSIILFQLPYFISEYKINNQEDTSMAKPKLDMNKSILDRRLKLMHYENRGVHYALRWTLICSRFMGVLPVAGVMNPTSSGVRFKLNSPYTLYYIVTCSGQVMLSTMSLYWLTQHGVSLTNITNSLFYASSSTSTIILASVAWYWSNFLSQVEELENKLPPFTKNVGTYCTIITFIILFMAMVEHGFSILYVESVARSCNAANLGERFFTYNMPWIFEYISFDLWKGILFEIFNIQSTFMWSYSDLLIMVVSLYLYEHFNLHFKLLIKAIKKDHFDAEIFRTQYLKMARLVNCFNARFGFFVLLSFGTNLYWICTQLFYSLMKSNTGHVVTYNCSNQVLQETLHGIRHTLYFSYSFSFLVSRTLLILLLAARVNSTSIAPLAVLYQLPSSKYNVDVSRYVDQIINLKVAISGYGFFYITRTMILTLVGSIITYELVLLQFNK